MAYLSIYWTYYQDQIIEVDCRPDFRMECKRTVSSCSPPFMVAEGYLVNLAK